MSDRTVRARSMIERIRAWHHEHVIWVEPPGFTRFYFFVFSVLGAIVGWGACRVL